MGPREQLERIMDRLDEDLAAGRITREDYDAEMREIQSEYREAAAKSAQSEYDRWFD